MKNENENNDKKVLNFPRGFLWGTSMSAYQVEGGNHNDWTEWERSEERLKRLEKEGKNPADYICGRACDFYHRYEHDIKLAKDMNNNAIRIGIEWSRLEPKRGVWNVEAVQYYRRVLTAAKQSGLTTVVTLWHWTNPTWFTDEGGWENKNAPSYFTSYIEVLVKELGGLIDFWVTLNEPLVPISHGYLTGLQPPGQRFKFFRFKRALSNLVNAHNAAYDCIKKHFPHAEIGIAELANIIEPARHWTLIESLFAMIYRYLAHDYFIRKIQDRITYIGIDYYRRMRVTILPPFHAKARGKVSDLGWEIHPEGIYKMIKKHSIYKKPIYIIENGLADANDSNRADFINEHLRYVHKAIQDGADVRGYFHWSLIDNFEWQSGFGPRFGLYDVDRKTLERTPRPSAALYRNICKNNCVVIE